MQRIPKSFEFTLPINKREGDRYQHVGDFVINATCFLYGDGSHLKHDNGLPEVEINSIKWNGEKVSEQYIKDFDELQHITLISATQDHAQLVTLEPDQQLENKHDAAETDGLWMADQAERAMYEHEQNF